MSDEAKDATEETFTKKQQEEIARIAKKLNDGAKGLFKTLDELEAAHFQGACNAMTHLVQQITGRMTIGHALFVLEQIKFDMLMGHMQHEAAAAQSEQDGKPKILVPGAGGSVAL